jgi:DNA-binding response OmpR family regulator
MLEGKRILIVDDEPDVLASLQEILDMSEVDAAGSFEEARDLLESRDYDAAILDIMGVDGYQLLEITGRKGICTMMLTAHALSPDHLIKSTRKGAHVYMPKEKMAEIPMFLEEQLRERAEGAASGKWLERLGPFFQKKFGDAWKVDRG